MTLKEKFNVGKWSDKKFYLLMLTMLVLGGIIGVYGYNSNILLLEVIGALGYIFGVCFIFAKSQS